MAAEVFEEDEAAHGRTKLQSAGASWDLDSQSASIEPETLESLETSR